MVMVADSVPGLKRWIGTLGLKDSAKLLVIRVVVAFLLHAGRMSCLRAAGAVRCEARHRAQISRFLSRPRWRKLDINSMLRETVAGARSPRRPVRIHHRRHVDQSGGKKTENTFSTGNRQRRPCKGRRYGKTKHARKNCHSFTMGLLITPSGIRIPFCKPYHTHEYCKKKGRAHRTTAEAAADLIRELPLPEEARVIVLGDTAYDAEVVRDACADRGYSWIFPCNPERVLAGPKGKRPKVRSLLKDWSKWSRQTIRLTPGQGAYAVYRRLSPHRIGPKAKHRTYYVHQERRAGALGRRGPARLFDNEKKPQNCHARRRENPDDERPAAFRARRGRVVLAALADRVIFQGAQVDAGLPPVPVPEIRAGGRLGGAGAHGVHVPGVVPGATDVATRLERRKETLVATPADLRPMPSGPFGERAKRIEVHRRPSGNTRRNAKTETNHP